MHPEFALVTLDHPVIERLLPAPGIRRDTLEERSVVAPGLFASSCWLHKVKNDPFRILRIVVHHLFIRALQLLNTQKLTMSI